MEIMIIISIALSIMYIYDRNIQRKNTLLINYPIIGRFRYVLEFAREPLRQYFGEDSFFASRDKINWVYSAARNKPSAMSFSPSNVNEDRFGFQHSQNVLNAEEIENEFNVVFGKDNSYTSNSIIGRSGIRDGSISPEATKAFSIGANEAHFPINTGEGGLTSNFLTSMEITGEEKYLEFITGTAFQKNIFKTIERIINRSFAAKIYRYIVMNNNKNNESFLLDINLLIFFRVNWDANINDFPIDIPKGVPDIILQIGTGMYGVRNKDGSFNLDRYLKVMRFCRMSEIKIAQGAKQIGGTLSGHNIDDAYAYYYNIEKGIDVSSPNRAFDNQIEMINFIGKLQNNSQKPVGIKIVISGINETEKLIDNIKEQNIIPDFITVDSGEGGSTKAPLDLVNLIGLDINTSVYILRKILDEKNIDTQIIASGKVLTGEEITVLLALGADFISIARGFMLSVGCIRARHCANADGKTCPVGIATLNKGKRSSFIISKQADRVENYHNQLIISVKSIMAVIGAKNINEISKNKLLFIEKNKIFFNIDDYFNKKLN